MTLVVPGVLILVGLGWGAYRLLIHTPAPPPQVLVIDPSLPPPDPNPGEVPLERFLIPFAGTPEVIVEMSVTLYYNNVSDRELIVDNLPSVRAAIFHITRNKGSQVVTDGGLQRALRQELRQAANEALGAEAISYVQLTQFRILH
jgi:flagellar basal body-associated protein FliL